MSREIKFRAYSSFSNKMHHISEAEDLWSFLRRVHGMEIMQHTGLKDKKGVEIYEGDIMGGYPHGTVEVKWNDEYACFEAVWIDGEHDESGEYYEKEISSLFANELHNCNDAWEVIGNIHQDSNLLI